MKYVYFEVSNLKLLMFSNNVYEFTHEESEIIRLHIKIIEVLN